MRILLTNDDGIHAEGLAALERIARSSPTTSGWWRRSTTSPASRIRCRCPIRCRLRKVGEKHYAVRGTPTDCVIMGCKKIMPELPDLILSGVNSGSNTADDVTYSGTIAGAMEGTMLGIRSIRAEPGLQRSRTRCASCPGRRRKRWRRRCSTGCSRRELPRGVLLNINFPNCAPEDVAGTVVTTQGKLTYGLWVEERADGRGFPYYWLRFGREKATDVIEGSDMAALRDRKISVTPLKLDLTAHEVMDHLAKALA